MIKNAFGIRLNLFVFKDFNTLKNVHEYIHRATTALNKVNCYKYLTEMLTAKMFSFYAQIFQNIFFHTVFQLP